MNSINIGWDSTKRAEMAYFHCVPSGQNKNERKGYTRTTTPTTKKNLRMTKSKENTLICISTHTHRHFYKYRYTYSHKHIFCSSQIVLFYIMFESV